MNTLIPILGAAIIFAVLARLFFWLCRWAESSGARVQWVMLTALVVVVVIAVAGGWYLGGPVEWRWDVFRVEVE